MAGQGGGAEGWVGRGAFQEMRGSGQHEGAQVRGQQLPSLPEVQPLGLCIFSSLPGK